MANDNVVRVLVAAAAQDHLRIVLPLPSEGKGHTFESCRVRQNINNLADCVRCE